MSGRKIDPEALSRLLSAEDQERLGTGVNNAVRALRLGFNKMAVDVNAWWRTQQAEAAKRYPGIDPARLKPELFAWRIAPEPVPNPTGEQPPVLYTKAQQAEYDIWVAAYSDPGPSCDDDEEWAKANGVSRPAVRQLRGDNHDPRLHQKGKKKTR
jgi:hypothetical protein